jgi:bifunctional ADP-heptose synthase (sugar kinase/adenylyltransferase)
MNKDKLYKILNNVCNKRIAVLGDFCIDFYWNINPELSEKSLNTGMLATKIKDSKYLFGGAGNVVQNILNISNNQIVPVCFGGVGTDPFGLWMKQNLSNSENIIYCNDYHTAVYCKPIINNIEQPRIDFGNIEISNNDADKLITILTNNLNNIDLLIINQQLKLGIHSEYFRNKLSVIIKEFSKEKIVISDVRTNFESYLGSIFKINTVAASMFAFNDCNHTPIDSGLFLNKKYNKPLVITDGRNGSYIFENNVYYHIPALIYEGPTDTIGARRCIYIWIFLCNRM